MLKIVISIWVIFLSIFSQLVRQQGYFPSFFYTLLILYFMYIVSTVLHILVNKKEIGDRYIVVYPFTFHNKIEFHPINLLYYPEMIRDNIYVNLIYSLDVVKSEKILFEKLNKIRLSRELCRLSTIFCTLYMIDMYFLPISLWVYGILYFTIFVQSYFGNNTVWIGNSAIIFHKKYFEIVLSKNYIYDVSSDIFREFLVKNHKNLNLNILLKIMFNYCNSLKITQVKSNDEQLIQEVISMMDTFIYNKGIENFILFNYLIFSIGFLGVEKSDKLIDISKKSIYSLQNDISQFSNLIIFNNQHDKMEKFLMFLKTKNMDEHERDAYVLDFPRIFNN